MRGAVLYAPGDVRVEDRDDPRIVEPTDAIIRLSATCVCGSDLWPYRGVEAVDGPAPMGHEYAGIVQEVGSQVSTIRPGQFVVGSFWACDNTCQLGQAGYQSACLRREPKGLRPEPPARAGCRGLPGHGSAGGDQGPPAPVIERNDGEEQMMGAGNEDGRRMAETRREDRLPGRQADRAPSSA
jgi:threonine dehydrogenase-like Zn-dependent dehydrogenase